MKIRIITTMLLVVFSITSYAESERMWMFPMDENGKQSGPGSWITVDENPSEEFKERSRRLQERLNIGRVKTEHLRAEIKGPAQCAVSAKLNDSGNIKSIDLSLCQEDVRLQYIALQIAAEGMPYHVYGPDMSIYYQVRTGKTDSSHRK